MIHFLLWLPAKAPDLNYWNQQFDLNWGRHVWKKQSHIDFIRSIYETEIIPHEYIACIENPEGVAG